MNKKPDKASIKTILSHADLFVLDPEPAHAFTAAALLAANKLRGGVACISQFLEERTALRPSEPGPARRAVLVGFTDCPWAGQLRRWCNDSNIEVIGLYGCDHNVGAAFADLPGWVPFVTECPAKVLEGEMTRLGLLGERSLAKALLSASADPRAIETYPSLWPIAKAGFAYSVGQIVHNLARNRFPHSKRSNDEEEAMIARVSQMIVESEQVELTASEKVLVARETPTALAWTTSQGYDSSHLMGYMRRRGLRYCALQVSVELDDPAPVAASHPLAPWGYTDGTESVRQKKKVIVWRILTELGNRRGIEEPLKAMFRSRGIQLVDYGLDEVCLSGDTNLSDLLSVLSDARWE